jgi:hypothetical protein
MIVEVIVVIMVISGLVAMLVTASYRAIANRRVELHRRLPVPFSEWESMNLDASPEIVKKALDAISAGLRVDGQFLRPDDQFRRDLALAGPFIIDDSTEEDIAEEVKERLGIEWQNQWRTVGEAVSAIARLLSEAGPPAHGSPPT